MKTIYKSKPKEVKLMLMEPGKLTEYDLGTIGNMELEITHNENTIKLDRKEIEQTIFTEKNWLGKAKRYYVFYKLDADGTQKLITLEEFNPYHSISSEEADIMLHEGLTMKGVRGLVTKVKGGGSINKIWIFIIIIVVAISLAAMKTQGMI